jgi:hypothetical protein
LMGFQGVDFKVVGAGSRGKWRLESFLGQFVPDFAKGIRIADSRRPQAVGLRSGTTYQAGIGPHSEAQTIQLVMNELSVLEPKRYTAHGLNIPYPAAPRLACDICLGHPPQWDWWIEAKLLRLLGDNGKLNDNMVMHILSPYPEHRSALTDCGKLLRGDPGGKKGVLIFGYDSDRWPMDPAIEAFEALARTFGFQLSERVTSPFDGLTHPVHQRGRVFAWEVVG